MRRLVSFLLLLCFAFYGIEAEVADVHDQEAGAAQVLLDDGAQASHHRSPGSGDTGTNQDAHTFHVCHCSHTHTGVLPLAPHLTYLIAHEAQQGGFQDRSLSIFRLAPPQRPPIA